MLKRATVHGGIVPLLLALTVAEAMATECVIVRLFGERREIERSKECVTVRGPADVCFEDRNGARSCQRVDANMEFSLLKKDPPPGPGFFDRLLAIVRGDEGVGFGGKRLKDRQQVPGFPYGEIVMPRRELAITVAGAGSQGVSSFTLHAQGDPRRPVFQTGTVRDVIRVPAQALRPGASYVWIAAAGSGPFRGSFKIIDSSQQADVERELESARQNSGGSDIGRRLLEAAVLDDNGYLFDRDAVLEQVRAALTGRAGQ